MLGKAQGVYGCPHAIKIWFRVGYGYRARTVAAIVHCDQDHANFTSVWNGKPLHRTNDGTMWT